MAMTAESLDRRTLHQWHRVLLCLHRLHEWKKQLTAQHGPEVLDLRTSVPDLFDLDVASFFLHCHHLADYLVEFDGREAVSFMKSSEPLGMCRDVVVHLKHAVMRSAPWSPSGDAASFAQAPLVAVNVSGGRPSKVEARLSLEIVFRDGSSREVVKLAEQCVEAWLSYGLPRHSTSTYAK